MHWLLAIASHLLIEPLIEAVANPKSKRVRQHRLAVTLLVMFLIMAAAGVYLIVRR